MRPGSRSGRIHLALVVALCTLIGIGGLAVPPVQPLAERAVVPTFTKDVAPILYANCTTCHRPGGLGPFSLLEYETARSNADDIRDAVKTGYMPPWHAEGPHGVFANDRRLSENAKQTILEWIAGGAPNGNVAELPPAPVYASSWEGGTPDAIVTMPAQFTVPASGTIEYQYFEIPTNFTEDRWVQSIEFLPGAREVVHHVLVYARDAAPATSAPRPASNAGGAARAASRPAPLFVRKRQYEMTEAPPERADPRNPPPRQMGTLIGGTAPGTNVMKFPDGTALKLRAGTILTFQMHYTANGHEMHDRTSVGFTFANAAPREEIRMSAFMNTALRLPAGSKGIAVPAELEPTRDIRIWGLLPHTHLRGTGWQYTLELPDGSSRVVLDVPRYDFNWQTYYFFATPLEMPAGAKLKSVARYDNATARDGVDVGKDVTWGDQTWEEMQYTGFLYSIKPTAAR